MLETPLYPSVLVAQAAVKICKVRTISRKGFQRKLKESSETIRRAANDPHSADDIVRSA